MNRDFILTVGLEIHAELKTRTKMFCDSLNDPDEERPNVNICPICMGYPGTLPSINKEAVKHILRLGLALGGRIADFTEFDRKNYFYPDIPKGYQISQYKHPLVTGGELTGVNIIRIHLEEDTARSLHVGKDSLLDFNRAGVPLMELVTEPVIHSAKEAVEFARELQLVLRYLGLSNANLEKGEMRVEANVSVSRDNTFGTKVEVKNLNSFKSVEKAINFEYERQKRLIEKGERIIRETRGWDEEGEETCPQREKEESHDYRYFPEPDLPKLFISELTELRREILLQTIPELPGEKRLRYKREYGLTDEAIEIYVRRPELGSLFEAVSAILKDRELSRLASNYITSDLKSLVPPASLAEVVKMISSGKISSRGAKDILRIIESGEKDPNKIALEKGLLQESDSNELEMIAKKIIEDNPEAISEYRSGKMSVIQFLIGQAMKETKGSANPQMLRKIFERLIS